MVESLWPNEQSKNISSFFFRFAYEEPMKMGEVYAQEKTSFKILIHPGFP
jgi:hypothetical protein